MSVLQSLLAILLPLIGKALQAWFEQLFTKANKAVEKKFTGDKQADADLVFDKAYALAVGHPFRRMFLRRARRAQVFSMTKEDEQELKSMAKFM